MTVIKSSTLAWGLIRCVLTSAALVWLYLTTDTSRIWGIAFYVPLSAYLECATWLTLALSAATFRWRLLLVDVGACTAVGFRVFFKIVLIGNFVSIALPGVIGGDAVRAYAARQAVDGMGAAIGIVIIERGLSLAALLGMSGGIALLTGSLPAELAWSLVLGGGIALPLTMPLVISLLLGWRPSARLPRFSSFAVAKALAWSAASQTATALALFSVVAALWPQTRILDGLAAALLAQVAGFLPAVAGLGPSQAAGTYLFSRIGVPPDIAATANIVLWGAGMLFVAAGGLIFVRRGLGDHFP